jgi:hypothetical protein
MKKKRPRTATIRKTLRLPARALEILACLLLLISSALPQTSRTKPSDYAIIFGTVWGPDDQPVAGMKVKIRRAEDKKARWERYSNRLGEFELLVPAGRQDYVIWADTKGYKLANGSHLQGTEVTVHVDSNEREDTGLHLK